MSLNLNRIGGGGISVSKPSKETQNAHNKVVGVRRVGRRNQTTVTYAYGQK